MKVGDSLGVKGFVTQLKYLNGRALREIEGLLGYGAGRLSLGATFAALDRLPGFSEFRTSGYSQVAGHRHVFPKDLDPDGIKRLAMTAWAPSGPNSLIKVMPTAPHDPALDDDTQYPPGQGVPQWVLTSPIPGHAVAILTRLDEVLRL